MRKVLRPLALVAMLAIVGAACSKNNAGNNTTSGATTGNSPTSQPAKVELVYNIGGRKDKSFNDSAAAGLDKTKQSFNLDPKELGELVVADLRFDVVSEDQSPRPLSRPHADEGHGSIRQSGDEPEQKGVEVVQGRLHGPPREARLRLQTTEGAAHAHLHAAR